jgi:hypothetical protein
MRKRLILAFVYVNNGLRIVTDNLCERLISLVSTPVPSDKHKDEEAFFVFFYAQLASFVLECDAEY